MRKLLIIALLIVGCDKYATADHTHEGKCVKASILSDNTTTYTCYTHADYDEDACLFYERQENDDDIVYAWFYTSCEEFCAGTPKTCNINSDGI